MGETYSLDFFGFTFEDVCVLYPGRLKTNVKFKYDSSKIKLELDFSPSDIINFNNLLQKINPKDSAINLELYHWCGSFKVEKINIDEIGVTFTYDILEHPSGSVSATGWWLKAEYFHEKSIWHLDEWKEEFCYFADWVASNL